MNTKLYKILFETSASDSYERKVLGALKRAGFSGKITKPAGASATAPDSDFKVPAGGNPGPHIMEIKMDWGAQLGGGSWRLEPTPSGNLKYIWVGYVEEKSWKERELQKAAAAMKKTLNKWLMRNDGALQKFRDYVSGIKAGQSIVVVVKGKKKRIKETSNGQKVNESGNGLSCSKLAWAMAVAEGLLEPLNSKVKASVRFMELHYEAKKAKYIQVGGENGGFFRFGNDASAANFAKYVPNVPEFGRGPAFAKQPFMLEMRATRGGAAGIKCSLSIRVQGRQKPPSFEASPYSMDNVSSIKSLMSAYNTGVLKSVSAPKKKKATVVEAKSINEREELSLDIQGVGAERSSDVDISPFQAVPPISGDGNREEGFFKPVTSEPFDYEVEIDGVTSNTKEVTPADEDFEISSEEVPEEPEMSINELIIDLLDSGYVLEDITEDKKVDSEDIFLRRRLPIIGSETPRESEPTDLSFNESLKLSKFLF